MEILSFEPVTDSIAVLPSKMIIFGSIAIGILFGYLIAIFSILSNKSEIRNLRNKNKILTDELNDLRNVAVDEGIYDSDDEGC